MGDINTNIRIDELETVVDGIAGSVSHIPAFYQMSDYEHGDSIDQATFDAILAAVTRGDIIRTGKLTRTGAQGYLFPDSADIMSARVEYDGTTPDIIYLTTTCSILDGNTATSRTTMLCDIQLVHRTATVIQVFLAPQYAVVST